MNVGKIVFTAIVVNTITSPLVDKVIQTVSSYLEVLMAKNGVRISKYNKEIYSIQSTMKDNSLQTQVIGFKANEEEDGL